MDKIRFFTLGGNDEEGKNMSVVEINDDIFLIDAGVRYPQSSDLLGVEYIIPDFKYLIENKTNLKGIFITHGHDDVMGALPYLLKEVNVPVYTTPLTALMIKDLLQRNDVKNYKIHEIKRNDRFKVANREVRTFGVTHSIPDTYGLAIKTDQGYIVHSSEFVIDFDAKGESFSSDFSQFSDIGKEGVLFLTVESSSADKQGFTSPKHRISDRIERIFEDAESRIITTLYDQNIYRLIEVIEMAKKHRRRVFFYNEAQRKLLSYIEQLGYYKIPKDIEVSPHHFNNKMDNVVIIVSKTGPDVFRSMHRIASGEDQTIQLTPSDTVVIASPIVPGTEVEAGAMEDELFKEGVRIESLHYREVSSMHASIEDIKMMLSMMKPKYYLPIKGTYQKLIKNADVGFEMDLLAKHILVLDNGEIATFENGKRIDAIDTIELETVLIDGKEHLDTSGLVLRDRRILATDGAIIAGLVINFKTKEVIGGPDVQSRGVIYLKNSENIMTEVGNILERAVEKARKEKRFENVAVRNDVRDQISKFVFKETGKRPMVLPVIIEVNL